MHERKEFIHESSQQALLEFWVLLFTLGVSFIASFFDNKSCYATIIVQTISNIYRFYPLTNNLKYSTGIKRQAICVVAFSVIMAIGSVVALMEIFAFTDWLMVKFVGIFLVAIPLLVIHNDYRLNIKQENGEM